MPGWTAPISSSLAAAVSIAAASLVPAAEPVPAPPRVPASGPLRIHPTNPRYFADASGRAVYLTGSHTWASLVDMGPTDPPARFDFTAYLDFLERHHHNFIRLWTWESTSWDTRGNGQKRVHRAFPQPFARTGPGQALDGKPRFDLERHEPEYHERLRSRVRAAGERGIYVSVMLFEGWGLQFGPGAWEGHPFHARNNVNGIDGDADGDGKGVEVHELVNPAVTRLQEAYIRKVVDTVNDLDNVLYEVSNENHPASTEWQHHVIRFVRRCEEGKGRRHPVGMTFQYRGGANRTLFESPADWVSPNPEGGYRDDPPPADGRKVVLSDTDHLWGIGGDEAWAWKTFFRGLCPLFMDPYDNEVLEGGERSRWDPVRRALGATRRVAEGVDLGALEPLGKLSSTGYCLARPGHEYLVYLPGGGTAEVDLSAAAGPVAVEWMEASTEKRRPGDEGTGGARRSFAAPFAGPAVLHLRAAGKVGK